MTNPMPKADHQDIRSLLQRPDIWRRGSPRRHARDTIPSGYPSLDRILPGGGWSGSSITEILHDGHGLGELRLIVPALARLSRSGRWVTMISPPHIPYAPALSACGIDLSHLLLVHGRGREDSLWAAEQALRSGTCAAVISWPGHVPGPALRRLQLAAETGGSWGILFRPGNSARQPSPAATRIHIETDAGTSKRLILLKARGGRPGHALGFALDPAVNLFDRSVDRPCSGLRFTSQTSH